MAPNLRPADAGPSSVKQADGRRCEEEIHDPALIGIRNELHGVVKDRRDDTGRAIGGRGDHAPTGSVLLVDSECIHADPIQNG